MSTLYNNHIEKQIRFFNEAYYEEILNEYRTKDQKTYSKILNSIYSKKYQKKKNAALYSDIKRSEKTKTYYYGSSEPCTTISQDECINLLKIVYNYLFELVNNEAYCEEIDEYKPGILTKKLKGKLKSYQKYIK